jgi:hypothetical protein
MKRVRRKIQFFAHQMSRDNRKNQPIVQSLDVPKRPPSVVVNEDAAAAAAEAVDESEANADGQSVDEVDSKPTSDDISFSVYNLRAPTSIEYERRSVSPSLQGSEHSGDSLKRTSSPICLIL